MRRDNIAAKVKPLLEKGLDSATIAEIVGITGRRVAVVRCDMRYSAERKAMKAASQERRAS